MCLLVVTINNAKSGIENIELNKCPEKNEIKNKIKKINFAKLLDGLYIFFKKYIKIKKP